MGKLLVNDNRLFSNGGWCCCNNGIWCDLVGDWDNDVDVDEEEDDNIFGVAFCCWENQGLRNPGIWFDFNCGRNCESDDKISWPLGLLGDKCCWYAPVEGGWGWGGGGGGKCQLPPIELCRLKL